jgi:short subunit dehydrogenase-like uncharacterized protein
MQDRSTRPFDVIVFGASGVTGRRAIEDLARRAPGRFAMAGRDLAKLEAVREELAAFVPAVRDVALVRAAVDDPESLRKMASQCRVVANAVGPYAHYGTPVVEACLASGTDHCDITGEVQWMRSIIERFDRAAKESGVRVVHACGFDSIPSDLGVLSLDHKARTRGLRLARVRYVLHGVRGRGSGGSFASLNNMFAKANEDPTVRGLLTDPYSLCPDGAPDADRGEFKGVRFDRARGGWAGPFFMAPMNERVVRRSNALLGYRYGRGLRYEESHAFGRGPIGLTGAVTVAAFINAIPWIMDGPWRRRAFAAISPKPGEGPTREQIVRGYFALTLDAETTEGDREGPLLSVSVKGDRDPGYGATGGMFAESALLLAEDSEPREGGVHTTASALGLRAIERMARAGVVFE